MASIDRFSCSLGSLRYPLLPEVKGEESTSLSVWFPLELVALNWPYDDSCLLSLPPATRLKWDISSRGILKLWEHLLVA